MKILFVDDSQERRDFMRKSFPDDIVFTAETSENAIKHMQSEKDFDIIYLDHDLGTIEEEPPTHLY